MHCFETPHRAGDSGVHTRSTLTCRAPADARIRAHIPQGFVTKQNVTRISLRDYSRCRMSRACPLGICCPYQNVTSCPSPIRACCCWGGALSWKHGLLDVDAVEANHLVLVVFRNASVWLPRMRVEPYNAGPPRSSLTSMSTFLKAPFGEFFCGNNPQPCYGELAHQHGPGYTSPLVMRTAKYRNYLAACRDRPENVLCVRYEDLQQRPWEFFRRLNDKHGLPCNRDEASFVPVTSYTGFSRGSRKTANEAWLDADWLAMRRGLDLAMERSIGYEYPEKLSQPPQPPQSPQPSQPPRQGGSNQRQQLLQLQLQREHLGSKQQMKQEVQQPRHHQHRSTLPASQPSRAKRVVSQMTTSAGQAAVEGDGRDAYGHVIWLLAVVPTIALALAACLRVLPRRCGCRRRHLPLAVAHRKWIG